MKDSGILPGTPKQEPRAAQWRSWAKELALICSVCVYTELCLHLCLFRSVELHVVYPLLFGAATGVMITLLASSLPRVLRRVITALLVFAQVLLAEIQLVYHAVFGNLMPLNLLQMGGGVISEFKQQTLYAIEKNLVGVVLLLIPLAVLLAGFILHKKRAVRTGWRQALCSAALLAVLLGMALVSMRCFCRHPISVWNIFRDSGTTTDQSYRNVGMTATTVQELRYILFGSEPDEPEISLDVEPHEPQEEDPYPAEEYHVLPNLDLDALAAQTEDKRLSSLDRYFAAQKPTRKNEYTGLMKNYNVIVFCAESYCPWIVSEELTPTLYNMSRSGIVFQNYYGTYNSVTTNGEYTLCLGLYPDMTREKTESSFDLSVGHAFPLCMGSILKEYGYTTWAYHNNNGEFYNRSQTHPNMGYLFQAVGSGLKMLPGHPSSDLEMIEASADDYLYSDQPFHVYYMTYSGHYQYNWDNEMSAKHRKDVEDLPYSEDVKAYVACNLELEAALSYLVDRLEDAGKLQSTVIVLTNDHYPYGLSEGQYNELAGKEIDTVFEKYRNQFICFAPGLQNTIYADNYCSTADILPTMLNLLGVEYDSRILAGVDALSEGEHVAVLSDGSFLTKTIRYDAATGAVYQNEENAMSDSYTVQKYKDTVSRRFAFSKQILETDYYAHLFPDNTPVASEEQLIPFDDEMNIHMQANILYIYRKGLMDLHAEREFAPNIPALVGEYITAIYRYLGMPEYDENALPENYPSEDPAEQSALRKDPRYASVCWAFEQGLLRSDDRLRKPDDILDNAGICLLLQRTVGFFGGDTAVNEEHLAQFGVENDKLTEAEKRAIVWALDNEMIRGDKTLEGIFADSEENFVNRYRLALFLIRILYPEMNA